MIAANVAPGNPYQAWLGAYGDPAYSERPLKKLWGSRTGSQLEKPQKTEHG